MDRRFSSILSIVLFGLCLANHPVQAETYPEVPDFFQGLISIGKQLSSPTAECNPLNKNPLETSWDTLHNQLNIVDPTEQRFFRDHITKDALNDHMSCRPHPDQLRGPCDWEGWKTIRGHQVYLKGGLEAPYRYQLGCFDGVRFVNIRIHWEWPSPTIPNQDYRVTWDYCKTENSLGNIRDGYCRIPLTEEATDTYTRWIFQLATREWNKNSNGVLYKIKYEKNPELAHFSVPVTPQSSRGPYFFRTSSTWGPKTVAHEVGHMFGLNDEYSETSGCQFKQSLMCSSGRGDVRPMHHYLVQRKAYCGSLSQRPLRRDFIFD